MCVCGGGGRRERSDQMVVWLWRGRYSNCAHMRDLLKLVLLRLVDAQIIRSENKMRKRSFF